MSLSAPAWQLLRRAARNKTGTLKAPRISGGGPNREAILELAAEGLVVPRSAGLFEITLEGREYVDREGSRR